MQIDVLGGIFGAIVFGGIVFILYGGYRSWRFRRLQRKNRR